MAKPKNSYKLPKVVKPGEAYNPEAEMALNAKQISYSMGVMSLREKALQSHHDINVLNDNNRAYLQLCYETGMIPDNESWYAAIGVTRFDASRWRTQTRRQSDPRYKELIDYIDAYCRMTRSQLMTNGRIHPTSGIWLQKNLDGYRDEPVAEPDLPEDEDLTAEQIKQQFKYLLDEPEDPE